MDHKQLNQHLADALGGTERAIEQLRYKTPSTASAKLLKELVAALGEGRKALMRGENWELEFKPELRERRRTANSMFLIRPYRYEGYWVFDDEEMNLHREPFVDPTSTILTRLTEGIPNADAGFTLQFSERPFPGHEIILVRQREEYGGWWYAVEGLGEEGWFGEPIQRYFREPPEMIYAQVRAQLTN